MAECVKKSDVINVILESSTLREAYNRVSNLQSEDVIDLSVIDNDIKTIKETRDQYEFRSAKWERLDNTLDSLIWAVKRWKGEK